MQCFFTFERPRDRYREDMPNRALALVVFLAPLTAAADDEVPVEQVPVDQVSAEPAPAEQPASIEVMPPGAVAPVEQPVPCGAQADDPCGTWRHGWRHHHHRKGALSIGFSRSHVDNDDDTGGTQKSMLARFNGRRGWSLELELSKLSLNGVDAKTGGVSIVHAFGRHPLAPYLIAGAGGGRIEDTDQRLHFAEAGAGLMLRKNCVSIGVDVRRGIRRFDDEMTVERTTTPAADDHERYTRGRVLALINF